VLNLADNNLGAIVGWTHHPNQNDNYKYEHTDGRHQKQLPEGEEMGKPEGVIAVANAIKDMGALTTLILKDNKLLTSEAGKVLSDMLVANTVLKELDVSSNNWDDADGYYKGDGPGFAQELAVGIRDNGALTSINVKNNNIPYEEIYQMLRMNKLNIALSDKSLTELDVSGIGFGAEGVNVVAQYASDNGAMTSINLSSNEIGSEGAVHVAEAIKVRNCVVLVVLVPNSC
jgi:hypothetical protein